MPKPTEEEKKTQETEHEADGKVIVGGVEQNVKVITKTKPNANGGYDTTVMVPACVLTVKRKGV